MKDELICDPLEISIQIPINDKWIFACSGEQGDPRMLASCCWLIAVVLAGLELPPDKDFYQDGTITDGEQYMVIQVHDTPPDHTTLTMLGGSVLFAMSGWDGSTIHIRGGFVGSLHTVDDVRFEVTGGQVSEIYLFERSIGVVETGSIENAWASHASSMCVRGNVVLSHAGTHDNGQLELHDGVVLPDGPDNGLATDGGTVRVYGGDIAGPIFGLGTGVIDLWGGNLTGTLWASEDSEVRLYGSGFDYDPQGGRLGQGLISGFWLDGTPLSLSLDQSDTDTLSHISFLPEPSMPTVAFLGLIAAGRRRILAASR